jgi:hypothetical protein
MTKPAAPVTTLDKLGGQAEAHVGNTLYVRLSPVMFSPWRKAKRCGQWRRAAAASASALRPK